VTHVEASVAGILAALQVTVSDAYRDVPVGPGARLQPPGALVPQSIPTGLNGLSLAQAYRLQAGVVRALMARWAVQHAGFKISCTGTADRALIGADEPTYGMLTDVHLLESGASIDLNGANAPLVEPELLLRLTREPATDASRDELADSVEVAAGLEVPISRFRHWWPEGAMPNLTLGGLVGDNSVAGFVVAGQNWTRLSASEIDSMTVELRTPDGQSARGRAGNVFGSPLAALSWLLGATRRHGVPVPSGAVVASGTFTSPVRARRGTYVADYSMAGAVSVTFEDNGFDKEQSDHGA
jgi:2-keto-4-pentenoate hydratase